MAYQPDPAADHKRRRTDGVDPYAAGAPPPGAYGYRPPAPGQYGGAEYGGPPQYAQQGYQPPAYDAGYSAQPPQYPGAGGGQPPAPYGGPGVMMGGGPPGVGIVGYERVFPAVKLRGLPFDVTEDDIRVFLASEPLDILLLKRNGRFSGEAFVVMTSPVQVDMAIAKDKTYLGRRYVEVFRAKKLDYYKGVAATMSDGFDAYRGGGGGGYGQPGAGGPAAGGGSRPAPQHAESSFADGLIKLRGLPFSSTSQDIVDWFGEVEFRTPLTPANVHMVMDVDGRPSGQAFAEFTGPEDAQAAMAKDRQMMGTRYIELFPCTRDEMERLMAGRQGGGARY